MTINEVRQLRPPGLFQDQVGVTLDHWSGVPGKGYAGPDFVAQDGGFFERNGVFLQLLEKSLGELSGFEGEALLLTFALILDEEGAKKRKFLAFFDSREAVEAAEAGFDRQGETIPEEIRGKRTSVHRYEVVIFDGDVDAAKAARVSLFEGPSEAIDAGLERTRSETLLKVREIDGNVGAIGLADRDNGRVSFITLWDSGDSIRTSAHVADQLRERSAELSEPCAPELLALPVAL